MPDRTWYAPAATAAVDDIDIAPAIRFAKVAFRWNDAKSVKRRLRINDMTDAEATDLLLVLAATVPDVYDRAVALEAGTR